MQSLMLVVEFEPFEPQARYHHRKATSQKCLIIKYWETLHEVSGFFALLLVVGATLMFFNFLIPTSASGSTDFIGTNYGDKATQIAVSRKLKENGNYVKSGISNNGDMSKVILTDYNGVDPPPSSRTKASLYPDPIEHGSPLIPYIPKPSPPDDSD